MPSNELRISALLQSILIALALGFHFRNTPSGAQTAWWAQALFVYALIGAVFPWFIGGLTRDALNPLMSVLLGVFLALPFWAAARWLADSPYRFAATGFRVLVWLWFLHLALSIALTAYESVRAKPKPSC